MSDHVVHTVSLVLPAADYTAAGRHQAAAKHWAKHTLPALLDRHLQRLHPGDDILYLEKIRIDIGDYPWNLTDAEWQEKIKAAIAQQPASPDSLAIIVQQWLFYLQHGCLEKAALLTGHKAIETYLLAHADQLPAALVQSLRNELSLSLLQRLFYQHTAALVTLFIQVLLQITPEQAGRAYGVLLQQLKTAPAATQAILAKMAITNPSVSAAQKATWIQQLLHPESSQDIDTEPADKEEAAAVTRKPKDDTIADTFIECPCAGLVLLFPYIKPFFENGHLIQNDNFMDEAAQARGVQALYFLATGQSTAAEEALILPKLLCGVALSTYMEWQDELPATLQQEGIELLQAVIDHWKVLQHTSVDGFRETFLQRPGRLIRKGNTWTLQVEESGVDILLNSIPWGFRHYRLPWMPDNIITEWY